MRFLLLFFCFLLVSAGFAQSEKQSVLKIKGITTDSRYYTSSRISDVTINVYDGNNLVASYYSDEKGKFDMDIVLNSYTVIEFIKEGFFPKRILFDTKDSAIDVSKTYDPFNFEISLIEYYKDFDNFDSDFPITRIEYSDKEKELISEELKNSGKPEEIAKKISLGKINKFKEENALLTQAWVMEPKKKVQDIIKELAINDLKITEFSRIKIGE